MFKRFFYFFVLICIANNSKAQCDSIIETYQYENGFTATGLLLCKKKGGIWRHYDKEMRLIKEISYKNNVFDGDYMEWHPTGTQKLKETYFNGKKHGTHFQWVFLELTVYKNGKRNGIFELFWPSGQLKERGFYKNNRLNGEYTSFYENGAIKAMGNYLLGAKNGLWGEWYPNAQLKTKGQYGNSQRIGTWYEWTIKGEKEEIVY